MLVLGIERIEERMKETREQNISILDIFDVFLKSIGNQRDVW